MRGIRTRVTAVALTGAVAALAVAPGLAAAAPAGCKHRPITCVALGDLARPRPSVDPVLLNPQPLPPRHDVAGIIAALRPHLGDLVALNPQPLPPGPDDASPVALNPQPLPPQPDEASLAQVQLPDVALQVGP